MTYFKFLLVCFFIRYEKDRLWKDASRRYKEVLQINPEHEEAVDRFHQIQLIISQQVNHFNHFILL